MTKRRAIYIGERRERNFGPMTYGMTGWAYDVENSVEKDIVCFIPDCREILDWYLPKKDIYFPNDSMPWNF